MQKKKSGVKKCLEICAIKGGGGQRLMENTILNFHFDYLNTSLSCFATMYIMGGDVVPIEEIDVIAYVYFGIILEPLGDYLFNVS